MPKVYSLDRMTSEVTRSSATSLEEVATVSSSSAGSSSSHISASGFHLNQSNHSSSAITSSLRDLTAGGRLVSVKTSKNPSERLFMPFETTSMSSEKTVRSSIFSTALMFVAHFVFLLSIVFGFSAGEVSAQTNGSSPLIESVLDENGRVKPGMSGSFDPSGFQMTYGPNGEPRFLRDGASVSQGNGMSEPVIGQSQATPCSERFDVGFGVGIPGPNGPVYAIAVSGSNVFLGGEFTVASGITVNGIAKWDGMSWSALGSGTNGAVNAIAVTGSAVYVGGTFTAAGGVPANRIAKWDGLSWSALGSGVDGQVKSLLISGGDVYVGGSFTTAGSLSVNRIAKWDGTNWSGLGTGANGNVNALAMLGNDLYLGGQFTSVGGVTASRIAKWNGTVWSALGSGVNSDVLALAVSGGTLYVGGSFTTVNGGERRGISAWNGTNWLGSLGTGLDVDPSFSVTSIAVMGSDIYIGGYFSGVSNVVANNIAKWNGTSWGALSVGVDTAVRAMAASDTALFVGGFFRNAGDRAVKFSAQWRGGAWSEMGFGTNGIVRAVAVSGHEVYVAGDFSTVWGVAANGIARWNGISWEALGSGVDGEVRALDFKGDLLIAGGNFSSAGGVSARNLASWNGRSWQAFGSGVNGTVNAIKAANDSLYIGGEFSIISDISAGNLARLSGGIWTALGSGTNGPVNAIEVFNQSIVVGGSFSQAGDVTASNIALWNGTTWSSIGVANGSVYAIAADDLNLVVGGEFSSIGGVIASNVAKWDGTVWQAMTLGVNGKVTSVELVDGSVYVAGSFSSAGGGTANRAALWNGSAWSSLGNGLDGQVEAIAASETAVYFAGAFASAGGTAASRVARWETGRWSPLRSDIQGAVLALAASGDKVYVGGTFKIAGGVTVNNIAVWDGVSWKPLGSGVNGTVRAIAVSGSDIYIGGDFSGRVARWNGASWSSMGSGFDGPVNALAIYQSSLYAGGSFTKSGEMIMRGIAKWSGKGWSVLGQGLSGSPSPRVNAITVFDSKLYVGGQFMIQHFGNAVGSGFGAWDGEKWLTLQYQFDGEVSALASLGSDLFLGGTFSAYNLNGTQYPLKRIARFRNGQFAQLGNGFESSVTAIGVLGSDVYAGGNFLSSGGTPLNRVGRWNGTSWSALGDGFGTQNTGGPIVILPLGQELYFGGSFETPTCSRVSHFTRYFPLSFEGSSNESWSVPSNWSTGGLPTSTSNLVISGADVTVSESDVTVNDLQINSGRVLNIAEGRRVIVNGKLVSLGSIQGDGYIASGCGTAMLESTSSQIGSSGGVSSFAMYVARGCPRLAQSSVPWININTSPAGYGSGSVSFTVAPNLGLPRTGTVTVLDKTFTVTQTNGCSTSLAPTSPQSVAASGVNLSISVTASDSMCPWTSSSTVPWITVASGSSGTGNGTTVLNVETNIGPPRSGTVMVGGNNFTVNQLSSCAFTLSSSSLPAVASGLNTSVTVNTTPGCTWDAVSNSPWISVISGAPGSGSGNVGLQILANTGPERMGTVSIADKTFTVTQESGCRATLTPTSINFSHTGGIGGFTLATNSACPWSASTPQEDWIVINNSFGTGNGSVGFEVLQNRGQARVGTINIGSSVFTVNQSAAPTGSIAGRIRYYFGAQSNISGVVLSGTGSTNVTGTSGADGTYSITGFGSGAYTLTPSKTGGAGSAISATDSSNALQYSVGLIQLTPNQLIAADVSGDGTVSALDASRIAQFSVGLTLPSGDQTGTWRFVPGTRTYASVAESLTGQDFTAILMGDITGNWFPPQSVGGLESLESVERGQSDVAKAIGFGLYAEQSRIPGIRSRWTEFGGRKNIGGDVIEVPISIADAMSILAYDAVITYDPNVIEPVIDRPIESNGTLSTNFNVVANRSERGRIRLAAYGIAPVTGNGDLLVLRFRVKKPGAKIEDANLRFESLMINEKSVITPLMRK